MQAAHITHLDGQQTEEPNKFTLNIQMNKLVSINYKMNTTLKQFHASILKTLGDNDHSVQFYSINGAKLPLSEQVQDLREFPILCQVDNNRVYAINFCDELTINHRELTDIKDQEHYFDFANSLGMRGYGLHSFSYLSQRLQMSLPAGESHLSKHQINGQIA